MKPDSPSRTIWRGECKRIKYLRKAPQEHWVAQNEGTLGWGFLNRGESLPCNRSFLEENQTLPQAPSSMGTTGSAIPSSLDAIPLYSQGLSPAPGSGSTRVQVQSRQVFPHHRSQTQRLWSGRSPGGSWHPPVPHRLFQTSSSLPPKLPTCPLLITLVYLKIFILSFIDYLRFYPQNVNFVLDNYLDCTSTKSQGLHLPYSQIVHFGPKDSIRFFLQNTYFSLQMTSSFLPDFFSCY